MAQGAIKSKPAAGTAKSGRRQTVLGPKKGARTIAPRKQALVRNAKMTKVCHCFIFPCVCRWDFGEVGVSGVGEGSGKALMR